MVQKFCFKNYIKPRPQSGSVVIELDEMWHYLRSKKLQSGYGRLVVVIPVNLLTGNVGKEIRIHLPNFTKVY
jgi:hypothetical protein